MTLKELMQYFERYYGEKYQGVFFEAVADYLSRETKGFYRAAAKIIPRRYSRIYNKAPGLAEFEQCRKEIEKEMPRPKQIEEPRYEPTEEERAECLKMLDEHKAKLKKKGAMAGPLAKTLGKLREAV